MGDAAPRRRVKWGRWALVGALALYLAPVIPGERYDYIYSEDVPSETRREWVSLSSSVSGVFSGQAAYRRSVYDGYDARDGAARADFSRVMLTLARFTGIPSRPGRLRMRETEAHLWLESGQYERAGERFLDLARSAEPGEWHENYLRYLWVLGINALDMAGQREAARAALDEALRSFEGSPGEGYMLQSAAIFAADWGEYDLAVERAQGAVARLGDHWRSLIYAHLRLGEVLHARYAANGDEEDALAALIAYEAAEAELARYRAEPGGYGPPQDAPTDEDFNIVAREAQTLDAMGRCGDADAALARALNWAEEPLPPAWAACSGEGSDDSIDGFLHAWRRCEFLSLGGRADAAEVCAEARRRFDGMCPHHQRNFAYNWTDPPEPLSCFATTAAASAH